MTRTGLTQRTQGGTDSSLALQHVWTPTVTVQHCSGYFWIFQPARTPWQCSACLWLELAGLYQRRSELSEWQIALSLGFTEIADFVWRKSGSIPHQYCNCLLTPITNTTAQPNISGPTVVWQVSSFCRSGKDRILDLILINEVRTRMGWFNYGRLSLSWYEDAGDD